jgi:hypothetical protein
MENRKFAQQNFQLSRRTSIIASNKLDKKNNAVVSDKVNET